MRNARDELIRIDPQGVAHPIGTLASQRMRQREGAYRMLPGPQHVVFMRYTGEDGRRDAEDGAVVRLAGEIAAVGTMCDVLALLGQTGWRGELSVREGETERSIYFDQGNVVGVRTNVAEERLGAVMYRFGALTEEQVGEVVAASTEGRRFGQVVSELGYLQKEQVYEYIGKQVEEVVFASLTVGDGTFFFLDDFDDNVLVTRHVVSSNVLLMDGVTRMDEMRYFREKIPSSDHVPQVAPGRGSPTDEFKNVFDAIDGKSSIEEIGRVTGLGEFETTKQLYALMQSKHVQMRPPATTGGPVALVATANDALTLVFRIVAEHGRLPEFRTSLDSFAVGGGVYDILFRNAGPDAHGRLEPDTVAENAVIVAGGSNPEQILKQMLYDYVSFALFGAGTILGQKVEQELSHQADGVLKALRP